MELRAVEPGVPDADLEACGDGFLQEARDGLPAERGLEREGLSARSPDSVAISSV
jgi:hypothetical protein